MTGPLQGVTVIELAGIGPGPFAGMLLADMGARVIRIDRPPPSGAGMPALDATLEAMLRNDSIVDRGRESIMLNIKDARAVEAVLRLVAGADVLIEGYRPGVAERLGLGPDTCLARNPRLIYGRMTGWGQSGPLAQAAGHDLNYIALSGALAALGPADRPPPTPLNLVGDYGGGGMLLVVGVLAALHEAGRSGCGQVVDAAMSDGAAQLMSAVYGLMHKGAWQDAREANFLDGAAPFYATYACADGRHIAIGAIEPQFWSTLLQRCDLPADWRADQWQAADWPARKALLAALFATRDRDAWCTLLEGTDACFAPVLGLGEAPAHAHNRARDTFVQRDGVHIPAPAPRYSRTPSGLAPPAPPLGRDTRALLRETGLSEAEITDWLNSGVAVEALHER